MSEEVKLLISVETQGNEKLADVSNNLGKLDKTTTNQSLSTTKATTANLAMNTSLMKAVPQLQAVNPLMGALGLSTLITTGAVGLLGLGFLKVGQSIIAARGDITDFGIALGQFTSGPATTYAKNQQEIILLANQTGATNAQTAKSMNELVNATHNEAEATALLNQVNQVSIDTHKSLSDVAAQAAQAYSQGAMINGKMVPAGMGAATGLLNVMDTQKSGMSIFLSNLGRDLSNFFSGTTLQQGLFHKPVNPFTNYNISGASSSASTPSSSTITINNNLDGNVLSSHILDIIDGQIRLRGGQ